MGYGGKVAERRRARELRAESWTLADIARELGVSKSSVSVWVRDVEFTAKPRNRGHRSQTPHSMHLAKLAEIERCDVDGVESVATLSERRIAPWPTRPSVARSTYTAVRRSPTATRRSTDV
jgi:transcriptional regulator with XRE-family HTH domain